MSCEELTLHGVVRREREGPRSDCSEARAGRVRNNLRNTVGVVDRGTEERISTSRIPDHRDDAWVARENRRLFGNGTDPAGVCFGPDRPPGDLCSGRLDGWLDRRQEYRLFAFPGISVTDPPLFGGSAPDEKTRNYDGRPPCLHTTPRWPTPKLARSIPRLKRQGADSGLCGEFSPGGPTPRFRGLTGPIQTHRNV